MFRCGDLVMYHGHSFVIECIIGEFCRFRDCSWHARLKDLTLVQRYYPASTCEQSSSSLDAPQLPLSLNERKVIALERIGLALERLANAKS